ncbi:metallopeptidase TldD-related protein [Nocardioides marmoribigeumensis]|uniref:Zn-dependent protease n=1 Tax=Nocardioides marmoribigeumensis TaxID=433649 RepID=A0ABU2C122_9ACTN|nr:metallopeptidase TldD-related protein [Nocardioides marmoribigeumensis]MDR7364310.1 putative Zn-dependent protease [Nocardioides marmoribigeumensis]
MTTSPTPPPAQWVPQHLVEDALAASTADDCLVVVDASTSANLRWANSTLTTNGVMGRSDVTVVSFVERDEGVASASVTGTAATTEQVLALVAQADAAAAQSEAAPDAAPLVQGPASLDWHDLPEQTDIDVYRDVAPALGQAFARATSGGRVLYGFVDHEVTTTYLGSSTGLRLRHVQPSGHWGCTAKPDDLSASAWVGGATRDFSDVDVDAMERTLERRLAWAQRRVDLPAGRYDTVLPPGAVADLMIHAYWDSSARAADDGRSAYARPGGGTRIGEQLAHPSVHLWSDPRHPGLESRPFVVASSSSEVSSVFDNGLPLEETSWISEGRLTSLLQTRETAALTGQPVTPAIDNLLLSVDGATGGEAELVGDLEHGLLLTCLWYMRTVDAQTLLLTGLTRDGVYLVEGGEVVGAVNNFRFNESPLDLLARFSAAGATVPSFGREWGDVFSRTATPALRVPDFHMSSVSAAL